MTDSSPPPDQPHAATKAEILKIAQTLHEHDSLAVRQIRRIVSILGLATTETVVAEALQIEEAGGLLVANGTRRRTLGGVFFVIVRQYLNPEQQQNIFRRFVAYKPQVQATDQSPLPPVAPAPPSITWHEREPLIASLEPTIGKATSVKVTLIGRPARVSEQAQFTLLTLTYTGPLPALPKGIPVPVKVPPTTYSVYIGKKQWKQVAEALSNPEDVLIVEGVQILDTTTKTIAVFATKTTTKLLQQANRPPKPPPA